MSIVSRFRAWLDRRPVDLDALDARRWDRGLFPGTYYRTADVFGEAAADRADATVRLANEVRP